MSINTLEITETSGCFGLQAVTSFRWPPYLSLSVGRSPTGGEGTAL